VNMTLQMIGIRIVSPRHPVAALQASLEAAAAQALGVALPLTDDALAAVPVPAPGKHHQYCRLEH
jgi:hypothetical protein